MIPWSPIRAFAEEAKADVRVKRQYYGYRFIHNMRHNSRLPRLHDSRRGRIFGKRAVEK